MTSDDSRGSAAAGRLTVGDLADVLLRHFGLTGESTELGSNEDQNFRVVTRVGDVVLKVTSSGTPRAALEAQNAALRHVAPQLVGAGVAVPGIHQTTDGRDLVALDGGRHVRVLDFLEGDAPGAFAELPRQAGSQLGRVAGLVVAALETLDVVDLPANERWDLRNGVGVVRDLRRSVPPSERVILEHAVAAVERRLADVAARLPTQAIHGDVTDDNVVMADDRIVGVIDFGDLAPGWRVAELAVLVASLLRYGHAAADAVFDAVCAFDAAVPLTDDEIVALWPLVTLRAAVLVASGADIARAQPGNDYASARRPFEEIILRGALALDFDEAELLIRQCLGRVPEGGVSGDIGVVVPEAGSVDLSVWAPIHDGGGWQDAATEAAALRDGWSRHGAATTRYGEYRLRSQTALGWRGARTLALGIQIAVTAGSTIRCPEAGDVRRVGPDSVAVQLAGGLTLHLGGLLPTVAAGDALSAGAALGTASTAANAPATVTLQLCAAPGLVPPFFVEPAREESWRMLCPDPSALVGLRPRLDDHPDPGAVLARRHERFAGVQGHYYTEPPQIERGWRHVLIDTRGRAYLDMVNNVALIGHGDTRLADAVDRQLRRLNTNSRFVYEALPEFVTELTRHTPPGLDAVFLVNSGSEAVDLALRLAQVATGRRDVAAMREAYHGWSMGSDAVSSSIADNPRALETRPDWVHLLPAPHQHPAGAGSALDATLRALDDLGESGVELAGMIVEPVFGNGGGILFPEGYLAGVWAAVRARGGLCVADEVQVGYGRLGRHFWGFEQQGVVPDIITMAKAMGNGHPLGAVITTREIADAFALDGSFFSSAGGSPVSCVVGTTVLRVLDSDGLMDNARATGDYLTERLRALSATTEALGEVHGMGLYLGLEVMDPRHPGTPDAKGARRICDDMLAEGVIIQSTGDRRNVLKIKPPLTMDRSAADHFVDSLERVIRLRAARESM